MHTAKNHAIRQSIVDARVDLVGAKSLCKILNTTGLDAPLLLIVTEGGLTAAAFQQLSPYLWPDLLVSSYQQEIKQCLTLVFSDLVLITLSKC